ncbi:flowering time control protein FPA-like [Phragmites australis]|uniref:flowering time control protein FPA-like n=1 Tax=Phragmites australis TaxID=29695 RepID=UPI002D76FA53|nr:flowering time control protein FPA-like [Phragmites australis]XP_062199019.1 flowering time control protein FPA-like [Phragmites australis]
MMASGRRGHGGRGRFGGFRGDDPPSRFGARVEEDPPPPRRASGWGVAPPSRHLWVGGLAPGVTASDLSELFLRCGEVEGIARDPGRSFAFVSFLRVEAAVAAVRELQGARLGGAPVRIEFSKGDKASGSSMDDRYTQYADERHSIERGRKRLPSPEKTIDKSKRNRSTEPSEVLWIGFPPGLKVDEATLWEAFSPFGEIIRITPFPGRMYAFVQYTSITAACRAKEALQGRLFNNPRVSICFSRSEGAAAEVGKRSFVAPYSPQLNPSARPIFRERDFEAFPRARPFDSPPRDFRMSSPYFHPNRLSRDADDVGFSRDNYFQQEPGIELGPVSNIEPFRTQDSDPGRRMPEEFYEKLRRSQTVRSEAPWHNIPERPRRPLPLEDSWNVEDNSYPFSKKLRGGQVHDTELPEYPFSEFDRGKVCPDYPRRPLNDLPEDDLHSRTYQFPPMHGRHHIDAIRNLTPLVDKYESWGAQDNFARHLGEMDRSTPERYEPFLKEEWKWNGAIAKGGTPICRARCFPVGKVLNFMLPEFLDCTARTSLDMLAKHYYQAASSWVVFFVPENDADMAAYNDFMNYLGDKQRAAVCKLGERSTLFLVPPSDFSEQILRVPGKVSISGVILKFQQSNPDYYSPNRKSLEKVAPSSSSHLNTDVSSHEDLDDLRRLNPPDSRAFPQGPDHLRSAGSYTPASTDLFLPYKPESAPPYVGSQLPQERPRANPRMGTAHDQLQPLPNMLPSGCDPSPGSANFSSLAQSAIPHASNNRSLEPYSFAIQGVPKGTISGYTPGEASNSMSWPSVQPKSQQAARPDQSPLPVSLPPDQLAQLAALLAQQNQPGKEVGLPVDSSNKQSGFIQNSNSYGHAPMMPGSAGSFPVQNSLPPVPPSMPQVQVHAPPIQGSLPSNAPITLPASAPVLCNTTFTIPPMHALVSPAHSSMPLGSFVPPLPEGPPPFQQHTSIAPTAQPSVSSGQQPSQQLSAQEELGDPQKRLQATLQLAATLLKQIQKQSNPGGQK